MDGVRARDHLKEAKRQAEVEASPKFLLIGRV